MDQVIAENPTMRARSMVNLIIKRGADKTIPLPDVIARYVLRSRPRLLPAGGDATASLIIDFTVLEMPVRFDDGPPIRPVAALVIDPSESAVVGISITRSMSPASTTRALLDSLRHSRRRAPAAANLNLNFARPDVPTSNWQALDQTMGEAGFSVETLHRGAYEHGQLAEALMGTRLAGIGLRPRLVTATLDRRASKETDTRKWLNPLDALQMARGRLVGIRTTAAFSLLDDVARHVLHRRLTAQSAFVPADR